MGATVDFTDDEVSIRFEDFGLDAYNTFLATKALPEYRIDYDRHAEAYTISAPARFAGMLGIRRPPVVREDLPLSPFLFDDQAAIVRLALECRRFACWSDCGLGKTLIELEFGRQVMHRTRGKFLLVSLNDVVPQIVEEAAKWYPTMPLPRLPSQADMIAWLVDGSGWAIANYEKFNPRGLEDGVINELRLLAGLAADESSRLKGGGDSKQKKVIIASAKGIEYKLSGTATPAPNDTIEFVSQALFLEKVRSSEDLIWSHFVRDSKTHRRVVKPHARAAFFDFMASWSIYLKDPKRFGWRMDLPEVPAPEYFTHELTPTQAQLDLAHEVLGYEGETPLLINRETNAVERLKLAQIARGFIYRREKGGRRKVERVDSPKPQFIADLVKAEAGSGHQVLVWSVFDEESTILRELIGPSLVFQACNRCNNVLPKVCVCPYCACPESRETTAADPAFRGESWHPAMDVLTGATPDDERAEMLEDFRGGATRVLISRPRMLGFGMNFQCCTSMVFSGFSESFEDLYQAVRRAVRFGQKQRVRVHFPVVNELESDTFLNLQRKAGEHERATREMEDNYLRSFVDMNLQIGA